jgi:tRNA pseudouridine55 synthase
MIDEDASPHTPATNGASGSGLGWAERLAAQPGAVIPLSPRDSRPPAPTPTAPPPMSGILNVYKPPAMTSHDVVQAVRKASGERRVGHAGTLDPLARGVLVVCLGSATRVIEELQATRKVYIARIRLGTSTTTYDAEGAVVTEADPSGVSRADVEAALEAFRGEILQTPPMYSALKHGGRRLYELARQGIEVERTPRPVTVHELTLTDWSPPEFTLALTVSCGTYIRSIAHDLGAALGVGAHLTELERTAVGPFTAAEAESLVRVVESFGEGWWPQLLHPLDTALLAYAALIVDTAAEQAIRNGQQLDGPPPDDSVTREVRAYNADGLFIGLLRWDEITGRWQPDRVFPAPKPSSR